MAELDPQADIVLEADLRRLRRVGFGAVRHRRLPRARDRRTPRHAAAARSTCSPCTTAGSECELLAMPTRRRRYVSHLVEALGGEP